jgi:hypothetical protein
MTGDDGATNLELALEMFEDGVAIQRENLRRRYPRASDAEIERALADWLASRPGAELGDGEGVRGSWPRAR